MPNSEILVSLITLSGVLALAWMTPGPNMLAVIDSALRGGWMAGFTTGLGISTGNIIWSIIALLGSDAIFDRFPQSILFIQLLGCIYLLYLGGRSLKTALTPVADDGWKGVAVILSGAIPALGHTFTTTVLSRPRMIKRYFAQQRQISAVFAVAFFLIAFRLATNLNGA